MWRNAISKDFAFNQIKLSKADIRPLSTKTIGTAKDGASMRLFGDVTPPLPLQLGGISKVGEDGRLIAAVMNSTDKAIMIQPGTCYGKISLTANRKL
jgi:hypothetical protein